MKFGNVIIFGVNKSLLSHADNHKNNFSVLCKGNTLGIDEALVHQRKK